MENAVVGSVVKGGLERAVGSKQQVVERISQDIGGALGRGHGVARGLGVHGILPVICR